MSGEFLQKKFPKICSKTFWNMFKREPRNFSRGGGGGGGW